jgi:hypothetical protein
MSTLSEDYMLAVICCIINMKRINNQLYLMLIAVFMLSSCSMSKLTDN